MGRKFTDDAGKNLPCGLHQPCKLVSVKLHTPDEKLLAQYPDMKPSWCFRFVLYKPNDEELHEASSVCFCSDTTSKLGKLYEFCTDLNNGEPPKEFDENEHVGRWFAVTVREKKSGKKAVASAFPVPVPANAPEDFGMPKGDKEAAPAKPKGETLERDRQAAEVRRQREEQTQRSEDPVEDEIPF